MRSLTIAIPITVVVLLVTAGPASAQWFGDIYLGVANTQRSEAKVTTFGFTRTDEIGFASSISTGVRGGRWFDQTRWLGLAGDVSFFSPDREVDVVAISGLLMARLMLARSEEFPDGRLRPYAAAGPGLFISRVDGTLGNLRFVSDTSGDFGVDVRLGVAFAVQQNLSLFTEYRFTHVSPDFRFDTRGSRTTVDTTFDTHHVVIGVSFRF